MANFEHYKYIAGGLSDNWEDKNLNSVRTSKWKDFDFPTGLKFLSREDADTMGPALVSKFFQDKKNDSWGILSQHRDAMKLEFDKLRTEILEFCESELAIEKIRPIEVETVWQKLFIRFKRLMLVLKPRFHTGTSKGKYAMAIAYWINNVGEELPSITKNYGSHEKVKTVMEMEKLIIKILSDFTNGIIISPKIGIIERYDFEIIVDNTTWFVDFKLYNDRNSANQGGSLMTYISLELWKVYQKTYTLL